MTSRRMRLLAGLGVAVAAVAGILVYRAAPASHSGAPCSTAFTAAGYGNTALRARHIALAVKKGLSAPALSIAVAMKGKLVWSESFGVADQKHRRPACRTTLVNIGSAAKVFTGAAAGQLWERGTLDLDAPIQRYVPSFPVKPWPITARELALHVSGIRHYEGDEFANTRHYRTLRQGLSIFAHDPLLFRPGTQFHYSSYGYNLLGVAIAGAAHEDYLTYMARHVFGPLHMTHTLADRGPHLPGRAVSYQYVGSGMVLPAPYADVSYKWPSGGYLSTPDDLVRFGSALMEPGFLKRATKHLLFTSGHLISGKRTGYAFRWQLRRDPHGRPGLRALGSALGSIGMLSLLPGQDLAIAMTMNVNVATGIEPGPTPDPLQIAHIFLTAHREHTD